MEITKLKILKLKNGNGLELSYEKPGPQADKISITGEAHTALIHNDLFNAIQALAPHLAIMAFHVKDDEVEDIAVPDISKFKDFSVGSYSIIGSDEKRGVIISGTLRKAGKAHNFNTPFYRFEEPESTRYAFMDDVAAKLRVIESEVSPFLDGSKRGEATQPEIPGLEEKVTKMQIADKVSPEAKHASQKDQHKYAGTEQMEGVAGLENGKAGKKNGTTKKVRQTSENPSGTIVE